jgi:hypothetical protein
MCTVSAVGDYWTRELPQRDYYPSIRPIIIDQTQPVISREEFDALKRDMEELKKLLRAAKEFDKKTGQPNCEMEEKIELMRRLAKIVGVELPI